MPARPSPAVFAARAAPLEQHKRGCQELPRVMGCHGCCFGLFPISSSTTHFLEGIRCTYATPGQGGEKKEKKETPVHSCKATSNTRGGKERERRKRGRNQHCLHKATSSTEEKERRNGKEESKDAQPRGALSGQVKENLAQDQRKNPSKQARNCNPAQINRRSLGDVVR